MSLHKARFRLWGRWYFWRSWCQCEAAATLTTSSPSAETFLSLASKAPSSCLLWLPPRVPLFFLTLSFSLMSCQEDWATGVYLSELQRQWLWREQFSALIPSAFTFIKHSLKALYVPKTVLGNIITKTWAKPDIVPAFMELTCKEGCSCNFSSYTGEVRGALKAYTQWVWHWEVREGSLSRATWAKGWGMSRCSSGKEGRVIQAEKTTCGRRGQDELKGLRIRKGWEKASVRRSGVEGVAG